MVKANRISARYEARTAEFRKRLEAKRAEKKLREEDDAIVEIDGVKLDAANTEVIFADEDKDIQVVASPDPENENEVVVAVLTASQEDVEEEEVLGSASIEGSDEPVGAEEARKAERREAFRKRLEAKRAEGKSELVLPISASASKPVVLERRANPRPCPLPMPARRALKKHVPSSVPKSARKPNPGGN